MRVRDMRDMRDIDLAQPIYGGRITFCKTVVAKEKAGGFDFYLAVGSYILKRGSAYAMERRWRTDCDRTL